MRHLVQARLLAAGAPHGIARQNALKTLTPLRTITTGPPRRDTGSGPGSRPLQLIAVGCLSAFLAWNSENILQWLGLSTKPASEYDTGKIPAGKQKVVIQKVDANIDKREHNTAATEFYRNQAATSLKKPGLYVWGSNKGLVAAPGSPKDTYVKRPRRIPFFDGLVLRDVKLAENFGVAVTEAGDVVEWGSAYDQNPQPEVILKNLDIRKVEVSADRIIALSKNGTVYSIPVSKFDQLHGPKPSPPAHSGPFWSSKPAVPDRSVRFIQPALGMSECIIDVKSGIEHCLLLTSTGRVFSAASSSSYFPEKGQLGVKDLLWENRPAGPYDQPYEVKFPGSHKIKQIAAGDYHSVALDAEGHVYSFGDNMFGQLGWPKVTNVVDDTAKPIPNMPRVDSIVAGGCNTFFILRNTKPTSSSSSAGSEAAVEIWAAGLGVSGNLGVGARTHITHSPMKVKKLSNLTEWDDRTQALTTISPGRFSVGATHSALVMQSRLSESAWPVYMWGSNENYELGTGKRTLADEPIRVPPLENLPTKESFGEMFMAVVPKGQAAIGEGKAKSWKVVEQRVECGRNASAVYLAV